MKNYFLRFCAFLLVLPGFCSANVVENGTFDDNTSGWVGNYIAEIGGDGFPSIDTGSYYWGGLTESNSIHQIYNLTVSELTDLSSVGLNFIMSGDLFGNRFQEDHSIFTATFYTDVNATGASSGAIALDSATNSPVPPGLWRSSVTAGAFPNFQSTSGSLFSDTKSIKFSLESIRLDGRGNDGYADNLDFSLITVASVPVPAAGWLFGSGLVGLIAMGKKCKIKS